MTTNVFFIKGNIIWIEWIIVIKENLCETIYQDCFEQLKPHILNVEMSNWSEMCIILSRHRTIIG